MIAVAIANNLAIIQIKQNTNIIPGISYSDVCQINQYNFILYL